MSKWYVTVAKEVDRGSPGPPNWWWTVRTQSEQDMYEREGKSYYNTFSHCAFTKWGAMSAAKRFARRQISMGEEVVILTGTLRDKEAEEQEKIDKEFQKLQRRLKKDAEHGKLMR